MQSEIELQKRWKKWSWYKKISHIIGPIFDSIVLLLGNSDFLAWLKLKISKRGERGTLYAKIRMCHWRRNGSDSPMMDLPYLEHGVRISHVEGTSFSNLCYYYCRSSRICFYNDINFFSLSDGSKICHYMTPGVHTFIFLIFFLLISLTII